MSKLFTRMGDGFSVLMDENQLMQDIEDGVQDASKRAKIGPLSDDEKKRLLEICKSNCSISGVEKGYEVVMTYDGGSNKIGRLGINTGRLQVLQTYERCFGADTTELSDLDYSFKQVKHIVRENAPLMEQIQFLMVAPVLYGSMPNLGLYTQPDGPVVNPAELLPNGMIKEAQEAYGEAIKYAVSDMVYVASALYEAGADGINFDTVGASGDPDFKATLMAIEVLKAKYPSMCVQIGMAGEFVLGMHGEMYHNGVRLAGLYPHEQVKVAQEAGADIFGPAINTNSTQSVPWNIARALTFTKACVQAANIPVHANLGMGVGGLPLCCIPPIDAVSMASKAHLEITRLDGL